MNTFTQLKVTAFVILLSTHSIGYTKDYIVEMVFFVDINGSSANPIHIPTQPITPDWENAILVDGDAVTYGFIPYPEEDLVLSDQTEALNKTGRYKILKHFAWLQPGLTKEEAIPVRIHAGDSYHDEFKERPFPQTFFSSQRQPENHFVNELDGTITIVLGRFLHVYTDLAYRRPFKINTDSLNKPLARNHILADFRIKSHRKMRSKELHYLDHPYLGILIEIRPANLQIEE